MNYLCLLRHGQSTWNLENKFTGWQDVALTPLGEEEALKAGVRLKTLGVVFDQVYVSTLERAKKTAEIVLSTLGQNNVPQQYLDLLKERDYGELTGLNKQETIDKYGKEQVHKWRRGFAVQPPKGESLKDVVMRVKPFYDEILQPNIVQSKNILITAHGNTLRALLYIMGEHNEEDITGVELKTGVPLVFTFENGKKQNRASLE